MGNGRLLASSERPASGPRQKILLAVTSSRSTGFLRGQVGFVLKNGYDVVVLSGPGPELGRLQRDEGIRCVSVPMARGIDPLGDLAALARIIVLLRRIRPDIINAGTPKAGLLVTVAAWLAGVHTRIYTLRGLRLETASGVARLALLGVERLVCALSTCVVCVSPSLKRRVVELGIVSERKAVVIGQGSSNGIDLKRFTTNDSVRRRAAELRARLGVPEACRVVGFAGRLVQDKGVGDLAKAWSNIRDRFGDLRLVLFGPWEDANRVPDDVRQRLTSDERVHFAGRIEDMPAAYALMDVVVLPTYREGFPNVLAEAAAMERPVVATEVVGCVDAVEDGTTGTLVPPGDYQALGEAIARYLSEPKLARCHGKAGRARMEAHFRNEDIWAGLVELYERVSSPYGGRRSPNRRY